MDVTSNRNRRPRRAINEINVVPYIDVMLVLLIIFMTTAPLLTEGVNVDLPKAMQKLLKILMNLNE
jgi:Cell division and transport-associated protein TolR (TC 2.C.1.2.1)